MAADVEVLAQSSIDDEPNAAGWENALLGDGGGRGPVGRIVRELLKVVGFLAGGVLTTVTLLVVVVLGVRGCQLWLDPCTDDDAPLGEIHVVDVSFQARVIDPPPFEGFGQDRAVIEAVGSVTALGATPVEVEAGDRFTVRDLLEDGATDTDLVVFVDLDDDPARVAYQIVDGERRPSVNACFTATELADAADRLREEAPDGQLRTAFEMWVEERRTGPADTPFEDAARGPRGR